MMIFKNEVLWFMLYLVSFSAIIVGYKYLGKRFLFGWVAMAVVIANIQVAITVSVFGMLTTLGNIVYGSIFLVTDLLNENYSKKEARKAVWLGFAISLSVIVIMQISMSFLPHSSDVMMTHVKEMFALFPRIVGASLLAYIVSQTFDTYAYDEIRKKFPDYKYIFLRNNGSTLISQLIDTAIFTFLAFAGVYPISVVMSIAVSTYLLKFIVSLLDTPFIYLGAKIKKDSE